MAIKSINFNFTGATSSVYDDSKTFLGSLMRQYTGPNPSDKFAGPSKIGMTRPIGTHNISIAHPHAIRWDSDTDWVFLADVAIPAAATRRIVLYSYNRSTSTYNYLGFITLTFPTTTGHTIRGFRVSRELYTIGDVGVSGTTVTGNGTSWQSDRMTVGSRIGFGSTDPTQIIDWYQIGSIDSDTQITLTSSAGTISAGTPYVIEDLRVLVATTNATATNGGFFVTKGLRVELFTPSGTTIPAATTIDNIQAVYFLADAATVTNTTAAGLALGSRTSWTDQRAYILNVTGAAVFVYNFRAALTLTDGRDNTTNVIKTGNQALSGTVPQLNNGRIVTASHGPGSGVESLYFVTTTRVYRSALTSITTGSTTWQTDFMIERPPGGVNTYAATLALSSIEYDSYVDRFFIFSSGACGARSYVTVYQTIGDSFDHIFLVDDKQSDQSNADSGGVVHPSILGLPFSGWSEDGLLHFCRVTTFEFYSQIYSLPVGAHQRFAFDTNELIISPKFDISDSTRLYNISIRDLPKLGNDAFSLPLEPYKCYYRTTGISSNTGSWTLIDDSGDLSGVTGTEIQFAFIFKILGGFCIPSRICGFTVVYEDTTTDSHYQPSVSQSSIASRIFAWRQSVTWGSNIPNLRIQLFNVMGSLISDDNVSSSAFGSWEYSSDGGSTWNVWDDTQDVVGYYIRYTATSLPSGVRVRALLTQQ